MLGGLGGSKSEDLPRERVSQGAIVQLYDTDTASEQLLPAFRAPHVKMRFQAQPTSATAAFRPPGAAGKSLARAASRAERRGAGAARSAAASALEGRGSTLAPLPQQRLRHGGARSVHARAGGDGAEGAAAPSGTPTALVDGPLRLELDTAEARRSLRFDVAPMGQGQAIIVVDVAPSSEADEVRAAVASARKGRGRSRWALQGQGGERHSGLAQPAERPLVLRRPLRPA